MRRARLKSQTTLSLLNKALLWTFAVFLNDWLASFDAVEPVVRRDMTVVECNVDAPQIVVPNGGTGSLAHRPARPLPADLRRSPGRGRRAAPRLVLRAPRAAGIRRAAGRHRPSDLALEDRAAARRGRPPGPPPALDRGYARPRGPRRSHLRPAMGRRCARSRIGLGRPPSRRSVRPELGVAWSADLGRAGPAAVLVPDGRRARRRTLGTRSLVLHRPPDSDGRRHRHCRRPALAAYPPIASCTSWRPGPSRWNARWRWTTRSSWRATNSAATR